MPLESLDARWPIGAQNFLQMLFATELGRLDGLCEQAYALQEAGRRNLLTVVHRPGYGVAHPIPPTVASIWRPPHPT